MSKIVYLPLDERPCNRKFPSALFESERMHIRTPEKLGDKKTPAGHEEVEAFLRRECGDADGLVLSFETLLYGGLIPSRLHHLRKEELLRRLALLRKLREASPGMRIFGFSCIMRCPSYSSDDEEPDYYQTCGAELHRLGAARHRMALGEDGAEAEARALEARIPAEALEDYMTRRALNLELNLAVLELAEEGIIDFLCIPQDDSAPLGFTAMDQGRVRQSVKEKRLQSRVMIYPGADELGLTLLSRMRNTLEDRVPAVYLQYAATGAPAIVPLYEDRPLGETLRYQLAAAGCRTAASPETADFILAVTAPGANMAEASVQPRQNQDYDVRRSLLPFFTELRYWLDAGKPVSICDNAYCNGGDLELLDMLDAEGLLLDVAGYAGWNTSSNTAGTAIAQGVRYLYEGADQRHDDFLALRYVEDCGYDSVVRQAVTRDELPELGLDYFHADGCGGEAARRVERGLRAFIARQMPSIADRVRLDGVRLPWRRMFEVDLEVRVVQE